MSLNINKHVFLFLAVFSIFILIPASFAGDLSENQTTDVLSAEDTFDAVVTANDNIIYVSPTAADDGNGSDENPCTISKAVENYDSKINSKIFVKNGEYSFFEKINLNKDITIVGESNDGVILNGNSTTGIFKTSGSKIILSNLKFVNGLGEHELTSNYAGGLDVAYGSGEVLIDNCIFTTNDGALSIRASNVIVNITNSIFENNLVEDDYAKGAAIYYYAENSAVSILNSTFKDNSIVSDWHASGGAIYGGGNFKSLLIDNCLFENNHADEGTAVYIHAGGDVRVLNSEFKNQTTSVIYDNQPSQKQLTLYLKNNTFDVENDENIVVEGAVSIVYLDNNDLITADNVNMNQGDDENFTVTLTDAMGNPIEGKEILINFTNYYNVVTVFSGTTNAQGQVTVSLKNQTPGRYKVLSYFNGDGLYNYAEIANYVNIKANNSVNVIMIPDYVKMKEGESFEVTGLVCDEYYEPSYILDEAGFSVTWEDGNSTHSFDESKIVVDGYYFTFDLIECSLKTRYKPYIVQFETYDSYEYICINLTVDLSVDLPDIDLDVIYVGENGNDTTGNGTQENPFKTVPMALNLNNKLGGGKTIVVGQGLYDISNFNILDDVTIVGNKSKTVFRQSGGNQGMFKIMYGNTVNLVNLTLIDGYTTPWPYSLLTVYGEGVVLNVDGCEFRNNTAFNGAVITISHGASANVDNSKFENNNAILMQSTAGAIHVYDGYLTVSNSEFINNSACDGGAIYVNYPGTADIFNSTFRDNKAYNTTLVYGGGGAVYNRGVTYIENCSFLENYADLYGGAIYISSGELKVVKSLFENNRVSQYISPGIKGSAIQSDYDREFKFDIKYSILLTDDRYDYLALFPQNDYAEIDVDYNYWGANVLQTMATNAYVNNYLILQGFTGTEPVYAGDNTTVGIEFKNYEFASGNITVLDGIVHDYSVDISSKLNEINETGVIIVNNLATVDYYANNTGWETVISKDLEYKFKIIETSKKDGNANITIIPSNVTKIIVEVPADLTSNVTIQVRNDVYMKEAADGKVTLEIDTLPGTYTVVVSYLEDEIYKGFSNKTSFTIPKYPTSLSVNVNNITENQAALVEVNITNGTSGKVVIVVNRVEYTPEIENGQAYQYIYDLTPGNYTVDVTYKGDDYYLDAKASTSFEVSKIIVPIEKQDGYVFISAETGSITTITVRTHENLTENLTIDVNGTIYTRNSPDGIIVLEVPTDESGVYTVVASYPGDEYYNEFSNFITFEIYDYCWFINDTGYRTLQEAVDAAEWGDVIKGNLDVYEIDESVNIGHRQIPAEPWETLKSVTITSINDTPVTIKGKNHRLFHVDDNSQLTLRNLILTGSDVGLLDGGAVFSTNYANVTIENCTFTNFTADRGGAVFSWGQVIIKDSVFENNYANSIGGAVFILSSSSVYRNASLDNLTFIHNSARSYGGAVYIAGNEYTHADITDCNFISNIGHVRAGAVYVYYGNVNINNTIFDSNKAIDEEFGIETTGGAVYISKYTNVLIENSEFINNYVEDFGGAMACDNAVSGFIDLETGEETFVYFTTRLNNCLFANNTADVSGGALYLGIEADPTVIIDRCVFEANNASSAAAISNNYGHLTVYDSKFTNNNAVNSSLIETAGFYDEEAYNAETNLFDCKFINNNVEVVINQLNTYTILLVENDVFDGESSILYNYGEATLTNVSETNKTGSGYSLENHARLYLSGNSFVDAIFNNGGIFTQTYIIVLNNETISVPNGTVFTLKAIVCDDNGNLIEKGNLEFLIDGKNISSVYENKEFTADYTITAGEHNVSAKYDDTGLNNLKVKTALILAKNPIDISVNADNVKVGENAIINVNVDPKASGNVTVKVNNRTYQLPLENGQAVFNISDLGAGIYPVEVEYSGDENYASGVALTNLTVQKIDDYQIYVNPSDITTNSAIVNVDLPIDACGNITVSVDGKNYTVPVKEGKASSKVSNLTIGVHDIEVTFGGDDKYSNKTVKTTLKLAKQASFVNVSVEDIIVGMDAIVNLAVPHDATGNITISIGDKIYLTTIKDGKASYSIADLPIGIYNVEATYIGDSIYLDSSNTTSFNVVKLTARETVITITGIEDDYIVGVLKDGEGNILAGENITYVVDGISNVAICDENGVFNIPATDNTKIDVLFGGNDDLQPTNASFTLKNVKTVTVVKVATNFDIQNRAITLNGYAVDTDAGEEGIYYATALLDANGKPVANAYIEFAVNNKIYNRTTYENGSFDSYKLNMVRAGRYTMAFYFAGDDNYTGTFACVCVDLDKKPIKIKASNKSYKASTKTKKYTVTLTTIVGSSHDGKVHMKSGMKVTLTVNGKTYTGKTTSNGQVTFKITNLKKKAKYTAKIYYKGDKTYDEAEKSVTLTVK